MASVSRESLSKIMDEHKAQFAAILPRDEVTPQAAALFEPLFEELYSFHLTLILLLLEKKTKKTSTTSGLPSSLFPFDETAPAKVGAKSKGPKHDRCYNANARVEVDECSSEVSECGGCGGCGEDLFEVASENQQRRVIVDIEFVTKEIRIDAQIKRCPNCKTINRGEFPDHCCNPN